MIEHLKNIKAYTKIVVGILSSIIISTASVFVYIDTKIQAAEHKVLTLRDQDMAMISSRLVEIKDDAGYTRKKIDELQLFLMRSAK